MISLHPLSREPAVTHKQGCNLRPQPSPYPPRRFQTRRAARTSQREHDKGQREGVVWLLHFFFFFLKRTKPSLSRPSETPTSLGRNYPLCFSSTTCELGSANLLLVFTLDGGLAACRLGEPGRSVRHALGKPLQGLHQQPREPTDYKRQVALQEAPSTQRRIFKETKKLATKKAPATGIHNPPPPAACRYC